MPRGEKSSPQEYIRARIRVEDRGHSSPCWIWQHHLTEKGYGRGKVAGIGKMRIHRASYAVFVGPIPDGLVIDHLCRVRECCNPDHLEPVTSAENTARGIRPKRLCEHGDSDLSPNGKCRPCRNTYMRNWMARTADVRREKRLTNQLVS